MEGKQKAEYGLLSPAVYDLFTDGICQVGMDGRVIFINKAMEELAGVGRLILPEGN